MPLFIHEEASGKKRLIANCKGGGHNAATPEEEALHVVSTAFAADTAAVCSQAILRLYVDMSMEDLGQRTPQGRKVACVGWLWFGLQGRGGCFPPVSSGTLPPSRESL